MKGQALLTLLLVASAGCLSGSGPGLWGDDGPSNFAEALIWSEPSQLVIQIHYEAGRAPSAYALDRLTQDLWSLTNKDAITILEPVEINVGDGTENQEWTPEQILEIHRDTYTLAGANDFMKGDQAFIHFVILNGHGVLDDGRGFIGLQTVPALFIFPDLTKTALIAIDGPILLGPPNIAQAQAEAAIFIHELGHALGLVGREAPETQDRKTTVAEDPCTCHSRSKDSVMYVGTESFNAQRYIEERRWVRDSFDAVDRADIEALRAKDPNA